MNLIEKYIGIDSESELDENSLNEILGDDENSLNEILGRGMATVLDKVTGNNVKKLSKLLKNKNIPFTIVKGKIIVGDDDFDDVEDIMVMKLHIF